MRDVLAEACSRARAGHATQLILYLSPVCQRFGILPIAKLLGTVGPRHNSMHHVLLKKNNKSNLSRKNKRFLINN